MTKASDKSGVNKLFWNVMVGITRSKVIMFNVFLVIAKCHPPHWQGNVLNIRYSDPISKACWRDKVCVLQRSFQATSPQIIATKDAGHWKFGVVRRLAYSQCDTCWRYNLGFYSSHVTIQLVGSCGFNFCCLFCHLFFMFHPTWHDNANWLSPMFHLFHMET